MTEEKTKKLTARERKNAQNNADAVRREIERTKRKIELLEQVGKIKFAKENYQLAAGFAPTFKYQTLPEMLEVNRQLDMLNHDSEIGKLNGMLLDAQARLDAYLEMLAERG